MWSSCEHRHPFAICYEREKHGTCYSGDNRRNRHTFDLVKSAQNDNFLGFRSNFEEIGSSKSRRRRRLRQKYIRNLSKCDKWTILHTNIRGFYSKQHLSLHAIINQVNPSVVTLNETHLKNNKNLKIPGSTCYS